MVGNQCNTSTRFPTEIDPLAPPQGADILDNELEKIMNGVDLDGEAPFPWQV